MHRLSAGTVVILAAISFTGLVALQIAWIQSAYQGELALYNKEKRQFELELQTNLKQDEVFSKELKQLLDEYNNSQVVSSSAKKIFSVNFTTALRNISNEKQYNVHPGNFGIARHAHQDSGDRLLIPIVLFNNKNVSGKQIEKSGKLCIHCILGMSEELHDQYNYQLLIFYDREQSAIYKRMGFLIAGSFLLLLIFGLLFRQMLKKYRQEKRLSESKNDFINNLSHELQTPVFAVQLANSIIKEKTSDRTDVKPLTDIIEKETYQLKQHARKILELASLENEQVELNLEDTDLISFIDAKSDTIRLMLQSRGGELHVRHNSTALFVRLDRVHFNNVLVSLTENAIKYNNGVPQLIIETADKENMICLRLTDNGIGIEPQYIPYVFDKFYRVPDVKRNGTSGFGLGLSYVKQIITLHKGQIHITSEPGRNTTVTILLPKPADHA